MLTQNTPPATTTTTQQTRTNASAKLDLSTITEYPPNTRQVYLTSMDPTRALTKINPFKLKEGIDRLCGPVKRVEYLRSGSIVITANSTEQVTQLLQQTKFSTLDIPIQVKIAWARHFTYGKLYAPEFTCESDSELLDILTPYKVVASV